jgi:putative Mg2+ transporter-C (MgtC) family protein
MTMPLALTWPDIAIRLALTMLAGAIIGFNRGARGHAAGFRTTILVTLAASLAMILTNILLSVAGKSQDSFATMDPMRLPLGILTGVGFIGAGTIVKKGDLITGVTTAATLWLVTVIGLCFGSGQLALGVVATALAVVTLWILKWADVMMPREHRARIVLACAPSWQVIEDVQRLLGPMKCEARFQEQKLSANEQSADYTFELGWRRPERALPPLDLLSVLESRYRIKSFELTTDNGR